MASWTSLEKTEYGRIEIESIRLSIVRQKSGNMQVFERRELLLRVCDTRTNY
jgi:hypothetical protein